jgi:peptidoglycan/xylan/chitin deacetylase (PgdA/CDA1 family)
MHWGWVVRFFSVLKWLVRDIICILIYYTGVHALAIAIRRYRHGGRIVVLAYHGVAKRPAYIEMFCTPELFDAQMAEAKRFGRPGTLADAVEFIRNGRRTRNDSFIVTFDDGYQDNLQQAWPIARKHGVPLHVFLTTGCIGTGHSTFIYALMRAIDETHEPSINLDEFGLGNLPLGTHEERDLAVRRIDGFAKPHSWGRRREILARVLQHLNVDRGMARSGMLDWDQARQLVAEGVDVGAHTRTHPALETLNTAELDIEIGGSKTDIEQQTSRPVRFFAYPYGGRANVTHAAMRAVEQAGFEGAVCLWDEPQENWMPYRIGRLMLTEDRVSHPWGGFSRAMFACEISGMAAWMFRRRANHAAHLNPVPGS